MYASYEFHWLLLLWLIIYSAAENQTKNYDIGIALENAFSLKPCNKGVNLNIKNKAF